MSRYRKTMSQAIEEGLSNMQIAILKKEYAPFKGKTITAARAKQLMNILDKFKDDDLKKLAKAKSEDILEEIEKQFPGSISLYFKTLHQLRTGSSVDLAGLTVTINRLNFLNLA